MPLFDGKFDQFLSVDNLRATNKVPTQIGTGAIRLKLNVSQRMYFWHPDLAADITNEDFRDRRHFFTSHVLVGEITIEDWLFRTDANGDHKRVYGHCQKGVFHEVNRSDLGRVEKGGSYSMTVGSRYTYPPDSYHRIRANRCVTLVERGEILTDFASVIRPLGASSESVYNHTSEARLWDIVADLLAA